jgi:fumarate reductase subunit D
MPRSREPLLWAMFGAGGMAAALAMPAIFAVLFVAMPLGWVDPPAYADFRALAGHPLVRIAAFGLVSLCFFHWAHRFRYTLYDGLQLYHLNLVIAVLTYGAAITLTAVAGYVLFAAL